MEISDYEQYYQKGGTYVLPIEVFNELWGEMENWKDTCKQKENIIKEVREYIKYQLAHLDFGKDTKAKMLGAMVLVMLDKEKK